MATFLEIATPLIQRGIPVIPVQPNEKRCLLPEWQNKATTDVEQVKLWQTENLNFNIGCVGKPDGFVMLDCDVVGLPGGGSRPFGESRRAPRLCLRTLRLTFGETSALFPFRSVLVTNWHLFNPRSEHEEGGRSYAVVNKGSETPETFSRYVLGDLFERMPIMVLNDEGHHCWPPANSGNSLEEDTNALKEEAEEATVWIEGLDCINQAGPHGKAGIALCMDMSATPFYIGGSGHPEGRPFRWLTSDFGLVDAIESGIVKIPRLPVSDTTGLPDPKYFRLWERIRQDLDPTDFSRSGGRKPKPEAVYREAEGALQQLAQQWRERFSYMQSATPGQQHIPPVMIVVCDNTEIAEVFYAKISGETQIEQVGPDLGDSDDTEQEDESGQASSRRTKSKMKTVYDPSAVLSEFANSAGRKRTIRIDTKLLAEAESEDGSKAKKELGEELRKVVATVGKLGEPGEHVRCVVSVAMLTEGWDANNVTHILGLRAFGSQLLCEQVVGRGLRRTDYAHQNG